MPTTDLHINSDIVNIVNGLNSAVEATDRLGNETKDYQQKSNQAFTSTETNIKEVNQAIKDQEKILKDLNRESEKYAKRANKLSADEQKAWKRLQGDIKVAGQEMSALKDKQAQLGATSNNVTSQISAGFAKLGVLAAGAFSVTAVLNFGKTALFAMDAQEKANKKLLIALKGNEGAQKNLINQSKELSRITLFQDEDIVNAQAMLGALIKDENTIKRLMPLVADFASAKEMDLASAADLVAKAVGGEVNSLARYGIQIDGAVGSSMRLESAMSGLNEAFGGQAQAAAETGAAAVQQLSKAWGEFAESIGYLIGPALTRLATGLTDATNAASTLIDEEGLSRWDKFMILLASAGGDAAIVGDIIGKNLKVSLDEAGTSADGTDGKIVKVVESLDSLKLKLKELKEDQSAAPLESFASFQPGIDALEKQIALYEKKNETVKESTKEIEKNLKTIADLEREQASLRIDQEIEADIRASDERAKSDEMNRKLREDYLDWEIAKDAAAYDEELRLQKEFNDKLEKVRLDLEKFTADHPIAAAMGFENEEQLDQVKDYVGQLVEFANELIDQQVQATQRIVDDQNTRIEEQQNLVNQEFQLKEEGLANNYRVEAENLKKMQVARDAAIKDREKAIRIQRTMSTIEAGVSLVTAAANIMKGFSGIPVVGVILGLAAVAAMIGGFIAAQSKVKEATQMRMGGRLLGPSHSEGGMRIEGSDVEVEGREWVVNARSSEKYNDVLTAINRDDRKGLQIAVNKHNLMKAFPVMSTINIDDSKKLGEIVKLMKSGDGMFMGNGFYIEQRGTMRKTIRLN